MNENPRHNLQSDLTWLIHTPALLQEPKLRWHPAEYMDDATAQKIATQLSNTELDTLSHAQQGPLGRYFETLARLLFNECPQLEVLAHNLVIRSNAATLGELDFLLHDKRHQRILHLEVALKFYLKTPHPLSEQHRDDCWVGANLHDRLVNKHQHLLQRQLKLPVTAQQQNCWPKQLPIPEASLAWVTGILFHHPSDSNPHTPMVAADALKSNWLWLSEFQQHVLSGYWIDKRHWLSPAFARGSSQLSLPQQFHVTHPNKLYRLFVVPDIWPND